MAVISFTKAKNLKPNSKMVAHGGVRNLWLRPSAKEAGVSSWVFRFKDPLTGKPAKMVIGKFPELGIAEAGVKTVELNGLVMEGKDPRRATLTHLCVKPTLRQVITKFVELKKQTNAWRSPATEKTFHISLNKYVLPYLGEIPIDELTVSHITN